MNFKTICVVIHISLCKITCTFNVDTQYPIIYSKQPETYFGYSVLFNTNSRGNWLLVGAPMANRANVSGIKKPGTVFQCKNEKCDEIFLDSKGNQETRNYYDLKDKEWLGVTLASDADGTIVACGHRWKNQKFYRRSKFFKEKEIQNYFSNGMCYTFTEETFPGNATRNIPLVRLEMQVKKDRPYFMFGMAGFSSHFTKDRTLLLGAPGINEWEGSLVILNVNSKASPIIWSPNSEPKRLVEYMYLGYSVTSSNFNNSDLISYIVGAPRYNYIGKVYIVDNQFMNEYSLDGEQVGEYFGAAICAIDLNGDDYDDLLVGAPLHAFSNEEGKVYVYTNSNGNGFMLSMELWGSKIESARFGMAITALGDIDKDGLQDFAIGAPYENGHGAVFIYHGDKERTVAHELTQKLEAKEIDRKLRGFGISIANCVDIDQNGYPDIAIGSYQSGHAVILRSIPVVTLQALMTFSPSQLPVKSFPCHYNNKSVGCFNITLCITYESPTSLTYIDNPTFEGPTQRAFFYSHGTESVTLTRRKILQENNQTCQLFRVFLKPKIKNYLTPIKIVAELGLPNDHHSPEFCEKCPLLSPKTETSITKKIYFFKGCGDDDICQSDLLLEAYLINEKQQHVTNPEIYLGLNKTTFYVNITNTGEAAYFTQLNITIPKWSHFIRLPISCSEHRGMNYRILICDVGNPLEVNDTVRNNSLELHLDIQRIPKDIKSLFIGFSVSTESTDKLSDNSMQFHIPVVIKADIAVFGFPEDGYIALDNSSNSILEMSHEYKILNLGPSPLDHVQVDIDIPEYSIDNVQFIRNVTVKLDGKVTECRGSEVVLVENGIEKSVPTVQLINNITRKQVISSHLEDSTRFQLFCDHVLCKHIECDIKSLNSGDSVNLKLELQLDTSALHKLKLPSNVVDYVTEVKAIIISSPSSSDIQPLNHYPDHKRVITSLDLGRVVEEKISFWIIPISISIGTLFLLIITITLYKCGFFKRSHQVAIQKQRIMISPAGESAITPIS